MAKTESTEQLLKDCLHAFNMLPNQRVGQFTTYELAARLTEELTKESTPQISEGRSPGM